MPILDIRHDRVSNAIRVDVHCGTNFGDRCKIDGLYAALHRSAERRGRPHRTKLMENLGPCLTRDQRALMERYLDGRKRLAIQLLPRAPLESMGDESGPPIYASFLLLSELPPAPPPPARKGRRRKDEQPELE